MRFINKTFIDRNFPCVLLFFFTVAEFGQMYGRYTKDLGEYAKNEARKLKMLERRRKKEDTARDRVGYCFTIFIHSYIKQMPDLDKMCRRFLFHL